ncbi:twinfilin-2 [Biomphalaria pfeifferi]|uniref:Twinfilin-2 n=1 Tax=Biomphalaria pfeifferi TaxID=112525 RepID=A0AAD8FG68_BIOPF|nr:twinfilin-2 [Biomphalaria pfeifferi]
MSHQTGITANDELRSFLAQSKDGHVRLIKVTIDNEQLTFSTSREPISTWENDILFFFILYHSVNYF